MKNLRPCWAEINLNNLKYNLCNIKKYLKQDTKILCVVKADAYGHGDTQVCKVFNKINYADYFGVAILEEALKIRKLTKKPILIMGYTPLANSKKIIENSLIQACFSKKQIESLNKTAKYLNTKCKIHIKIDTGMSRLGIMPEETKDFFKYVKTKKNIIVEGVFSHFSCADSDKKFTEEQFSIFQKQMEIIKALGFKNIIFHICNSAGLLADKKYHLNMARPGIALYGYPPIKNKIKTKPVMALKSKIISLKELPKGSKVSYNATFKTKYKTLVGVLPIGYADGYSRLFSNKSFVIIKNKKIPVIGNVCMDMCMVNLNKLKNNIKINDIALIFGVNKSLNADILADLKNTISYEILTLVGKRVPRIYI